ncbi:MAG: prepilin peptidase [Patescibacteria group bacterium]|nr:prepilin peptidase [Patescibacteria group bacterium]
MFELFIFIFGLVIGSFLNVVILRLEKAESFMSGRSRCPNCKHNLAWYDNIPLLSFIFLRANCRYCHTKISWQYPIVELATAVLFSLLYYKFDFTDHFFSFLLLTCFLIIIFVYDLKYYLIPDVVSIPAIIVALLLNIFLHLSLTSVILGAIVGGLFFALQYWVSRGVWVGDGDIRLGILMGLILGFKILLVALFLAYLVGAMVGVSLLLVKKKQLSSALPFGPFLTLATFVAMIWGEKILFWYLNLVYY